MTGRRVIVVGAGIVGCCLAKELTDRGVAVTVLDAAEAGARTSASSFAWVNANSKEPLAYAELNLLGLRAHERWAPPESERSWFHRTGNIAVASDAASLTALEAKVARFHEFGYRATLLDAGELAEIEPGIEIRDAVGAAVFPEESWIDTSLMCHMMLDRAIKAGAAFLPFHRVVEPTATGVRARMTLDAAERTLDADVVVFTAGNGIRPIMAAAGVDFPIMPTSTELREPGAARVEHPTVGLICTTTPVVGAPRHMVHTDGVSLRQSRNGGLTLTDHPTASQWDAADPRLWQVPQVLLERARRICPALVGAAIDTVALGNRVLPIDGVTIADWVDPQQRMYAVATHSGVTLAAHLAEAVADEVTDGVRHASLADFGLARFGSLTATE